MAWRPARAAALAVVALLAYVLASDLGKPAYDDSYFFKRFAVHLLDDGVAAWNVADGPVHGLTSQLWLLWSKLVAALTRDHWIVAMRVSAFAAIAWTAVVLTREAGRATRRAVDGATLAALALVTPPVTAAVHSGMETPLALLLTLAALLASLAGSATRAALATAVLCLCRPDAALIPVLAFACSGHGARALLRFASVLGAVLGVVALIAHAGYGSALPLAFAMKTRGLSPYGDGMQRLLLQEKLEHLATWVAFAAPLAWLAQTRPRSRGSTTAAR